MTSSDLKKIEKAGFLAVLELRRNKLSMGFPFMINTSDLPSTQFYLEYPDGYIKIAAIRDDKLDYKILTELTMEESDNLRKKYKLPKNK